MIREIINFTENLIADIPDIMQWKVQPSTGLHVFIDIDANGNWVNHNLIKGVDYDYFDGKNKESPLWNDCNRYQVDTDYITMNKVQKFDSKQKIHSCSPFAVAFNFNFNDEDKKRLGIKTFKKGKATEEQKEKNNQLIRKERILAIKERLNDYKINSQKMFWGEDKGLWICQKELESFYLLLNGDKFFNTLQNNEGFSKLGIKDYVRIYLRSVNYDILKKGHDRYLQQEIFNGEELHNKEYGALGFLTTFAAKKPFLKHKTAFLLDGVSQRFTKGDALTLYNFGLLLNRKIDIGNNRNIRCIPNPLPIVIDRREINTNIISIYNNDLEPLSYKDLITKLFKNSNIKELSNYYLLNYVNTMSGIQLNDFDFVPLFRYKIGVKISNILRLKKNDALLPSRNIDSVFDLENELNKFFVKYHNDTCLGYPFLIGNYFGDKVESQKSFKSYTVKRETLSSFYKYRHAIYDYIYKSQQKNMTSCIFDDIAYSSIYSDMQMDECKIEQKNGELKKRHTKFFEIREKLNIWFSLYNLFNNNIKQEEDMTSKVTELVSKMSAVAKGESHFENPEEFAFGAGQIVSYLIDRSVASNKTYAMLEPYLQKSKSGHLQDAIAQTIAVYKHDINTYKGAFQCLSSDVLTYDGNIEVKPLLKFFLAGCFCDCVIYQKKDNNNN